MPASSAKPRKCAMRSNRCSATDCSSATVKPGANAGAWSHPSCTFRDSLHLRRFHHDRRKCREPRNVHDGCDHAPAFAPGFPVADEQSVAEQRFERIAHLRGFALEAGILQAKGELNGIRTVAQKRLAHENR